MAERIVRLTRRVGFSSGHRYWLEGASEAENRKLFGKYASRFNHGHNYVLDVTVEGSVDPSTAMVVNIKTIDELLQENIVARLDGKSLNDEVPELAGKQTCVENILGFLWDAIKPPGECRLTQLRLEETPTLYGEMTLNKTTLTRTYEFAASHRLNVPALSEAQNVELFGKCNNPAGHGHNYVLEVTVCGAPDPRTGMIAPIDKLDESVTKLVLDRYDHKNLNCDLPEFEDKTTTSEAVATAIFDRLNGNLPATLERVRLWETARSCFEVNASA